MSTVLFITAILTIVFIVSVISEQRQDVIHSVESVCTERDEAITAHAVTKADLEDAMDDNRQLSTRLSHTLGELTNALILIRAERRVIRLLFDGRPDDARALLKEHNTP